MSRENVEVVRRIYEAVARRDTDAVLATYDPAVERDISRHPLRPMFGSDVYRGLDGVKAFFREWYGAWEDVRNHPDELIDAGHDDVVAVVTDRGRGTVSGAEVTHTHAAVWTIRAGKVVRVLWVPTRDEALAAAERTV